MFGKIVSFVWESEADKKANQQQTVTDGVAKSDEVVVEATAPIADYVDFKHPQSDSTQVKSILDSFDALALSAPLVDTYFKACAKIAGKGYDDKTKNDVVLSILELSAQSFSKEKLLEEFNRFVELIRNEKLVFDEDAKKFLDTEVSAKLKVIESTELKIKKLNEEIVSAQNDISSIKNDVADAKRKLDISSASFDIALTNKINEINSTINQLK